MGRPLSIPISCNDQIVGMSFCGLIDKKAVMDKYSVSEKTAERLLVKLGLTHTRPHLIEITKKYLSGISVRELAIEYGVSQVTINAFFRRHGITQRYATYLVNHDYFEFIDSEDKAYFLGFIFADGCVYKNRLRISLNSVDTEILEKFSSFCGSNKPVMTQKAYGFKKATTESFVSTVELVSTKIVEDLEKYAVKPNKTTTAEFPNAILSSPFLRDFLRGYIDGDGSFSKYRLKTSKEKFSIGICGTKHFLEGMQKIFKYIANVEGHMYKRHATENCCYTLAYSGERCVKKILHYLYDDSHVYLERKYLKFRSICA